LTFNLFYAMIANDMELIKAPSHRGLSVRSIFVFVFTVILTALLWVTLVDSATSHAVGDSANWKGQSITYSGNQYFPANDAKAGESHKLATGTKYYVYVETISERPLEQKAKIIYFTPGLDPPTATTAQITTYDYSSSKEFSNPQDKQSIDITPQGESSEVASSCTIEGLGWVICPVTLFLAGGMGTIFDLVAGFLNVQPTVVGDPTTDLYIAWNVMRTIANVAFIIIFLIIIYSQLTSAGISNYGLKKLLPRLIVAAILVNLSFFITAIAVDISNILGYGLQDVFDQIRQNTFAIDNDSWSTNTEAWTNITIAVLSGGGIIAGGIGLSVATGASIVSAIYLLIPILVGVLLTILFVFLVLAARQAIIIILIIVAPLAFVAYLLPNTEKWFEKWRDLFMSMLIFFPAFALVFGGSQLASAIIIQNANSVFVIIFGLAVQVAPLVITPLLLKLSSGLLGRIAGLLNDPRKGALDRTKNWSKERADMHRQKSLSKPGATKNPFRRVARSMDNSNRRVKESTGLYSAMNDNRYNSTDKHEEIEMQSLETQDQKQLIEAESHARYSSAKLTNITLQSLDVEIRNAKATLDNTNKAVDVQFENLRVAPGEDAANHIPRQLAQHALRAQHNTQEANILARQLHSAQEMQQNAFGELLADDESMQIRAGGIDPKGAQRALAAAFTAQAKAHNEAVSNASSIISHYNYGDDAVADIALNNTANLATKGVKIKITDDVREAAIGQIAGGANATQILNLMTNLEIVPGEGSQMDFRQTFADTLIRNGAKPKFAGAGIIGDAKQGIAPPPGKARIDEWVAKTINANKLASADVLVTQDRDYLDAIKATLAKNTSSVTIDTAARTAMRESIKLAKKNPLFAGKIGERIDVLTDIEKLL